METPDANFVGSNGQVPKPIEFIDGPETYEERVNLLLAKRNVTFTNSGSRNLLHEDVFSVPGWYAAETGWRDWSKGQWEEDPLAQATIAHIKRLHGENLVFLTLHRDEKTAHFHAGSVPLVFRERGRRGRPSKKQPDQAPAKIEAWALDHRHMRGIRYGADVESLGRQKLSAMQDEYHGAIKHLGISRGKKVADLHVKDVPDYRLRANRENAAWQAERDAALLQLRQEQAQVKDDREKADRDLMRAVLATMRAAASEAAAEKMQRALADDRLQIAVLRKQADDDAADARANRLLAEDARKRAEEQTAQTELARREMVRTTAALEAERIAMVQQEAALHQRQVEIEASAETKIEAEVEARVSPLRRQFERALQEIANMRQAFLREKARFLRIQEWARMVEAKLFKGPEHVVIKAFDDGVIGVINKIIDEDVPAEPIIAEEAAPPTIRTRQQPPFTGISTERD